MGISNYALDTFVSPNLSRLTKCNATDLSDTKEERSGWIPNFVLNTILRRPIADDVRSYAVCFLRKAEAAHRAHERGREALVRWVARRSVRAHAIALSEFEGMLANMDEAYNVLTHAAGMKKLFEPGEGSVLEKLRELYNASKHAAGRIRAGTAPSRFVSPVWITNDGIQSENESMTFGQISESLDELRSYAKLFSSPPRTVPQEEDKR